LTRDVHQPEHGQPVARDDPIGDAPAGASATHGSEENDEEKEARLLAEALASRE